MSFYLGNTKIGRLNICNGDRVVLCVAQDNTQIIGTFISDTQATSLLNVTNLFRTQLAEVQFDKVKTLPKYLLYGATVIKKASFASATNIPVYTLQTDKSSSTIEYIRFGPVNDFNTNWTNGDMPNLRNFIVGEGMLVELPLARWTATNVIAEGESGINELNENILSGIVNQLPDRTGLTSLTITLSTSLYNVLKPETLAAFTNKGWNVAYS